MFKVKETYIINRTLAEVNSKFNKKHIIEYTISNILKERGKINVLEVGAGEGRASLELCKRFENENVEFYVVNKSRGHGILNEKTLLKTCKKYDIEIPKKLPKVHIENAENMSFQSNKFDFIFSVVAFIHIRDKFKALKEVYRVLKPSGKALIHLDSNSKFSKSKFYTPRINIIKDNKQLLLKDVLKPYKNVKLMSFINVDPRNKKRRLFSLFIEKRSKNLNFDFKLMKTLHIDRTKKGIFEGNRGGYVDTYLSFGR